MTLPFEMIPLTVAWVFFAFLTFGFPQARGHHAATHGIGSKGDLLLFFMAIIFFCAGHAFSFWVGFVWGRL